MEIKVKFEEVLKLNNTLKSILDDGHLKLNVLLKFRFLGVMKALEPHLSSFEVIRNEKIIEYGKKNSNGDYQIREDEIDALKKFNAAIGQVLKSTVTVNLEMLSPNEVFNSGLRSDYLMGLYPIIKR